ncbi:hypothetical protein EI427_01570 [Flammeovirga pectinis]|uniref:DUF4178 domain-containing protein n=1 Tax=Flammeovirga pectinis TaxID=2494373 RepID=A0A3Q9FN23_9BACT|nr:TM2 domain-containing protein [Flammeovirga pectinis]AZQ60947.1 hypothetical protein EI427_01570 [Flammeovirga pectinis]
MSKLIVPKRYAEYLPYSLAIKLKELPEKAQYEFIAEFRSCKRSTLVMYLAHFFPIPFSLGYAGKWFQQFLFWISGGGFGIWWLVMLFTMPSDMVEFNRRVAVEVFKDIAEKYKINITPPQPQKTQVTRVPKSLDIPEFDPTQTTIDHLKPGFLLDLEGKTWQVISEYQFDVENESSQRQFRCIADLEEQILSFTNEGLFKKVEWKVKTNIYQVDPEIEKKIQQFGTPPNILYFKGHRFYKEITKKGHKFDMAEGDIITAEHTIVWSYLNEERDLLLHLEKNNHAKLSAYYGKAIDENYITEILPHQIS